MMTRHPQRSLPGQADTWSDLKAAYRFLNNPRVGAEKIGVVHRQRTRQACAGHPVVLCVQDDSDLCDARIESERHVTHSTLAVRPTGELLGMLQQRFFPRIETPDGETRKQRASRWRESDVWPEAVREIGPGPAGTRFVHVADRGADNLRFMHRCVQNHVGFVARAHHDRRINQGTGKLWTHLESQPVAGTAAASIGTQRNGKGRVARRGRDAKLAVRFATVRLDEPSNCHEEHEGPLTVNVVHPKEIDPPAGADVEAVDWMLLSSEPVTSLQDALGVAAYYRCRWVIEEWRRALKEGCRLERSQLERPPALYRLTAILSVVAIRLIQLRDLANEQNERSEDHATLKQVVPPLWIVIVATLARLPADRLTPRQFWQTIARRGGWLGRKHDGSPGWKAIWAGWHDVQQLAEGAELAASIKGITLTGCG